MLPQRDINLLAGLRSKTTVFCIGHNANNCHERSSCLRRRCIEQANTFSYCVLIGPMVSGDRFVNQRDQWGALMVGLREDSAAIQPCANHAKVIRCDDTEVRAHGQPFYIERPVFNLHHRVVVITAEGEGVGSCGSFNAGQRFQLLENTIIEGDDLLTLLIRRRRQREPHRQHVIGP